MIEFAEDDVTQYLAHLKVIGVGGGGCNAINKMIEAGVEGVECIAANTDYKSLRRSKATKKIQLGKSLTKGLGSGGNPSIGKDAANESVSEIQQALEGADMVVVACGMGGGTGTGSAPIVAEISKKMGILTVGVVSRPFEFEGPVRKAQAEDGLKAMLPHVDAIVVIPNERINLVCEQDVDLSSAFNRVDDVLVQAIQGISVVIHSEGIINRDFADVKRILTAKGKVLMGTGYGTGEDRALKAVQKAVNSPLLEDVDIAGATAVLVQVTAGANFSLNEFNQINGFLQKAARPGAEIVPGIVKDENLRDGLRVTIIATGFDQVKEADTATVIDLKNFVNPNFQTSKGATAASLAAEELENDMGIKLTEGQYEIPAYLRRRLASKPFNN
ncbi:MAG TPA: cell division protein FtsZ [bacterium]|nr:cell division protein FtsZ [bacterium]